MPTKPNSCENVLASLFHERKWDDFGIQYLLASRSNAPEHSHSELQIFIPLEHSRLQAHWQTQAGQKRSQNLQGNDICIVPSQQPHTVTWEKNAEIIFFFLHPKYLSYAASDLITGDFGAIGEHYGTRDLLIHQLGLTLRTEFLAGGTLSRLYIESLVNILAVHLLRTYAPSGSKVPNYARGLTQYQLRCVFDYINENLEHELSLNAIASVIELSPYHFARSFKQAVGLTPHQYVTQQRIARAKGLLSKTQLPITEICNQVGFQSQSHFTQLFRKYQGMTPKVYRTHTHSDLS